MVMLPALCVLNVTTPVADSGLTYAVHVKEDVIVIDAGHWTDVDVGVLPLWVVDVLAVVDVAAVVDVVVILVAVVDEAEVVDEVVAVSPLYCSTRICH